MVNWSRLSLRSLHLANSEFVKNRNSNHMHTLSDVITSDNKGYRRKKLVTWLEMYGVMQRGTIHFGSRKPEN